MNRFLFADEAGDFDFSRKHNVSRYYIICAVTMDDCEVGHELLRLRRKLAWDGYPLGDYFHASTDKQKVRDAVFDLISQYNFNIYAKILEKSKAQPQTRTTNHRFYHYGWFYLLRYAAPKIFDPNTELLITTASVGTKRGQAYFTSAVNDVVQQIAIKNEWQTYFCPASSDPCLQVADYCTWAIQRKWERGDTKSYGLIAPKIRYEYDLWGKGTRHYY